jgi:hypothetical protein
MFGVLGTIIAAPVAIARAEYEDRTPQFSKEDGGIYYHGYRMHFTGWKETQGDDNIVGQWVGYPVLRPKAPIAYRKDSKYPFLYSSVPGANSAYLKGSRFDICPQGDQNFVNWRTASETEKEVESNKGKKLLMAMIDAVMNSGMKNLSVNGWNKYLYSQGVLNHKPACIA